MQITMSRYFMAVPHHCLHRVGIALGAPARDEESLSDIVVTVSIQYARHSHIGPIAQHRGRGNHAVRFLRMGQIENALGIHVECEAGGAACPTGPRNGIAYHGRASPDQAASICRVLATLPRIPPSPAMQAS